jgi:hypothetical protein
MQGRNGYTSLRVAPLFSYTFFKVVGVLILANLKPTKTRFFFGEGELFWAKAGRRE